MTDPFPELPKFPGEQADPLPDRPGPPDTPADRLRHAFPALVMIAGAVVGLFVAVGVAILVIVRGVEAGWLFPLLMLAVFLTLPAVAIGAAVYQRAKYRRERGEG
jgi:hypothetical protein